MLFKIYSLYIPNIILKILKNLKLNLNFKLVSMLLKEMPELSPSIHNNLIDIK